jgi:carbon monoxide dehydrogenase subunit G
MIIEDGFDVQAPVERVWALLRDVPRVAGCIPNAEITEIIDPNNYRARVGVKVGPVSVAYNARIAVEEMNDATHQARLKIDGDESKGRGGVSAIVTSNAEARGEGTHIALHADAKISGIVATVGGRLVEGVAKATIKKFAENLAALL